MAVGGHFDSRWTPKKCFRRKKVSPWISETLNVINPEPLPIIRHWIKDDFFFIFHKEPPILWWWLFWVIRHIFTRSSSPVRCCHHLGLETSPFKVDALAWIHTKPIRYLHFIRWLLFTTQPFKADRVLSSPCCLSVWVSIQVSVILLTFTLSAGYLNNDFT